MQQDENKYTTATKSRTICTDPWCLISPPGCSDSTSPSVPLLAGGFAAVFLCLNSVAMLAVALPMCPRACIQNRIPRLCL